MRTIFFIFTIYLLLFNSKSFAQVPRQKSHGHEIGDGIAVEMPPSDNSERTTIYSENTKYGFQVNNTKQPAIYDKITSSMYNYIVKANKKFGLAGKKGEILLKAEFDSIYPMPYYSGAFVIIKQGKSGAASESGQIILEPKYGEIHFCSSKHPFAVLGNPEKGLEVVFTQNSQGKPLPVEFITVYSNLSIVKSEGKYGIIHQKQLLPFEYDSIYYSENALYGNSKPNPRKPISSFNYNSHNRAIECLVIQNEGKLGLVNAKGDILFPTENDVIQNNSTFGYYAIRKSGLFALYFIRSGVKTDVEFSKHYKDGIGYVMAVKNKKTGVFNMEGTQILPFEYDDEFIAQYSGLGLRITKNKKRGIVDPKGNTIIPPLYDEISTFYQDGFKNFIQVKNENKYGVVNLKNDTIIPIKYSFISDYHNMFKVITPEPDEKCGLYDKNGKNVLPANYLWIRNTDSEESNIIVLIKGGYDFDFYHLKSQQYLDLEAKSFGYVHDEDWLLHPNNSSRNHLLRINTKTGKTGLLNEISGTMDVPAEYDNIYQQFEFKGQTYFAARKKGKHGVIDAQNNQMLPFLYDTVQFDLLSEYLQEELSLPFAVVVKKNKHYGVVDINNSILIPIQYADVQRISGNGLYKVRKDKTYKILNVYAKEIHSGPFDEVGKFEVDRKSDYDEHPNYQALTFYNGSMRIINDLGKFTGKEMIMQPHKGYRNFNELKYALIAALEADDNILLKEFASKVAPSSHLLYFLKENIFNEKPLNNLTTEEIKEKYYQDLLEFKETSWQSSTFKEDHLSSLLGVEDYTQYGEYYVTNTRYLDQAFGDRTLELFLRNSVKINGYWISTYFMKRQFN